MHRTLAWGDTRFRRFAPQGFGQNRTHGRDRSLESILEWKPEQPVSLVGGVSFLEMKVDQFIDLTATPLGTGSFKDRQPSFGLFGEADWHPAPRLTLTAGIRYQSDRKKRTGALGTVPQLPIDYDETDHAVLPKISGAYDLHFLLDGQYDDQCYFNSPVDYLPNLSDDHYLRLYREHLHTILAVGGPGDICHDGTRRLAGILADKGIPHTLDVWEPAWHDWPWWKQMALKFF